MTVFSLGTAIFQIVYLIILAAVIGFIVLGVRAFSKRSKQMDRIEKKLDDLSERMKKDS